MLTVSFKLRKWVLQIRMTPNGRTSLKILALPRLVSSPHQSDLKGPMSQLQGPLWVWCVLKTAICQLGHESCIPHICHRHHRRCLCKFFPVRCNIFLIEHENSSCILQICKTVYDYHGVFKHVLCSFPTACDFTLDGRFYTIYRDFTAVYDLTQSVWPIYAVLTRIQFCHKYRVLGVKYFNCTECLCKWNDKYEVWKHGHEG